MKRILSNIVFIFGIIGFVSLIVIYLNNQPWNSKCDSEIKLLLYFALIFFIRIAPYLSIILFLFSEKTVKSLIGLILNILTILLYIYPKLFTTESCG